MKNTNIAIFERNEKFLGALCEYFEKTDGFAVCATALSGDAALEALKVNKPDVAIIDTALKGIDGIKLLDHIKSMYPACLTFMMSEFDNDKIVNSAINHGAIYYFIKPVTPQVIGERVADQGNKRALSANRSQIFYNVKQSRKSNKTRNRGCLEQR